MTDQTSNTPLEEQIAEELQGQGLQGQLVQLVRDASTMCYIDGYQYIKTEADGEFEANLYTKNSMYKLLLVKIK